MVSTVWPGMLRKDALEAIASLAHLLGKNIEVGLLGALARAAHGLMNHDLGVGRDESLAGRSRRGEHRTHGSSHA